MPINDFEVLTRFSEVSSFSFIFRYILRVIFRSMYSRMDRVKFVEVFKKFEGPYHFKLFKGRLPQILLGPFLNTLTRLLLTKFSIFLRSKCFLLAIFLKFIFNQKEKYSFIWPKTSDLLLQKHLIYNLEKRDAP